MDDTISRQEAINELVRWDALQDYDKKEKSMIACCIAMLSALPTAESELENKIRAIGYTGKEGRIYIGGRLFAVRELPQ